MIASLAAIMTASAMGLNTMNSVFAETVRISSPEIPDHMQPGTVIKYVSDTEYIILEGGISDDTKEKEDVSNTIPPKIAEKMKTYDKVTVMEKIKPNTGTEITYANDGRILRIQKANIPLNARSSLCAYCGREIIDRGTEIEGKEWFMWGGEYGCDNQLEVLDDVVNGYGRFTNFTDRIGELDNILKKGDVATRHHVDNPPYGTKIYCTANGYKHTMIKRDTGCLPDAVLDIWKTGLEYFGVSWSPNASISGAEYYRYKIK